jgi:Kef-type K+ transport system membrane component KefB
MEDLVSSLFLPLYFASSGLKTNVATITGAKSWGFLVLVITTACAGKIGGTVAAALLMRVPAREALALGLLMNTKGLVELIVLNIGATARCSTRRRSPSWCSWRSSPPS